MSISTTWDAKRWNALVKKIEKNLDRGQIDRVLEATAYRGLRAVAGMLPKKTGALARSWFVKKRRIGEYQLASMSKVALFLEEGTKAHGPKTAKFLYIPLRPGAAIWRKGFVFGQDYILVKHVKGIKAHKYLKPLSVDVLGFMVEDFSKHLSMAGA